MIRVREVDGRTFRKKLEGLQKLTLPNDRVFPVEQARWWIAYWCEPGKKPEIAGFAGLTKLGFLAGEATTGYLCRAGVRRKFRGKGIQRRLIKARVNAARRDYYTRLVSTTFENPVSSNNLIRCGFTQWQPAEPWGVEGTQYWEREV